jgi:hypothetical protein
MKANFLLLPLAGAAFLATAGEPVKEPVKEALKPEPITSEGMTLTVTNRSSGATTNAPAVPDQEAVDQVAERIALSDAITVKPLRPAAQKAVDLFNPFAPMEPAPDSRWLSRAPWGAAAVSAVKPPGPVETHHEARFGFVLAGH